MSFTRSLKTIVTVASGAAGIVLAAPVTARVIEIGDDGAVTSRDGPTVTTEGGSEPIVLVARGARPAVAAGRGAAAAASTPAVVPIPAAGPLPALFAAAARLTGVDQRLLHAVAWHESRFRQNAVSPRGAIGIMQLMPETARALGVDPRDAVQNIRGGAILLASLLRRYGGDVERTLAAYNAGIGAVQRYGGIPPFAETRAYVDQIRRMLAS